MTEGIVTPIASSPASTARGSGGRTIGYGEFGDPNGKPVVLFHGFGDSRLTRFPDDELTARLGIRLITFDRPGIGLTDPMKELTILDRTDDVIDLVNSLGLQDISLLGWSGGAPFALAAAGCMAGKVKRVAIVSGFGPFERPGFKRLAPREIKRVMTILKVAPWMANVMATESQKGLQGDASAAMEMSRGLGGSADAGVLNMGGVRANVTSGAEEAFRQGPAGVANDMLLLFRFKWGFNPEDVHSPVDLWYGDDDHMTPPDVGRGLASVLPQPRLRMVPGAGHLLYLRNWEEILRTLVADEAPATTSTFQAIAPVAPLSPVTEALAASSVGETTPVAEPEHAELAGEPVTAQGDVLGSTPAWSWTQPAAASQPSVEEPADEPAVQEPVAYQAEPAAPLELPELRPAQQVASASGDQLARLRALGFMVDLPEPVVVAPEVAEPEAATAEPAAAEPEAEMPESVAAAPELSVVETEADGAPAVEDSPAAAEVARPELKLVEPEAAPKRPSLTWQPMRVPGLIIGKPRRAAPVEPVSPVTEPVAETTPEADEVEIAAEAAHAEPEAAIAEPEAGAGDLESAAEAESAALSTEPEPDAVAETHAEAVVEPDSAADAADGGAASPAIDSAEAERLRAAGFVVSEPAPDAGAPAAEGTPPVRVADDELARLRAAGFAPAEAAPVDVPADFRIAPEDAAAAVPVVEPEAVEPEAVEPEAAEPEAAEPEAVEPEAHPDEAVEPEAVEAEEVEPEAVEPEAVEPEAVEAEEVEAEAVELEVVEPEVIEADVVEAEPAAEADTPVAEVEAAPIDEQPGADAESTGVESEPVVAEAATDAESPDAAPVAAADDEPATVATDLEQEAPEPFVLPAPASDAADGIAGPETTAPHSQPAPAIAASAADAPVMKPAAQAQSPSDVVAERTAETGVGWVETTPMEVEAAAGARPARSAEPDTPPEPMVTEVEEPGPQPPVRDETMERLRAAGFLIGEPRGR